MARIVNVHAHPDDEASKGAPTIAKYVAAGHEAVLVCCTGGERGDILNPAMDRPEIVSNLPEVRRKELAKSMEIIGYQHLEWLGYQDSGMADDEGNLDPDCFAQAENDQAVSRLVSIIRRYKPHVIITYGDDQPYKHPDHLMVHDITVPAYHAAGDPGKFPTMGRPWQPQKLYYSHWSTARLVAHHEVFKRLGRTSPYGPDWFERPSQDHRITTKIEMAEHYHVRSEALRAHATQVDPDEPFWFGIPDDEAARAYPYDDYILAHSHVEVETPETDLLAGLEHAESSDMV